jgi:hypothetical protein
MSTNEWSQLKKVIIGIADGAKIPPMTKSLRTVNYADKRYIEYSLWSLSSTSYC